MSKSETLGHKLDKEIKECLQCQLVERLNAIITDKHVTNKYIRSALLEHCNYDLNSGTLSHYLNNDIAIPSHMLPMFAKVLDCSVSDFFTNYDLSQFTNTASDSLLVSEPVSSCDSAMISEPFASFISDDDLLTYSVQGKQFDDLLGKYYCYFWPTSGGNTNFQSGYLYFTKENEKCKVKLAIQDHTNARMKKYVGIAAESVSACFCMLRGKENLHLGDMCFIVFSHPRRNAEQMKSVLAETLTISAGNDEKVPTSLRLLITKKKLDEEAIRLIKPSLYMNTSRYIIDSERLDYTESFSEKENKVIAKIKSVESSDGESIKNNCYSFNESLVKTYADMVKMSPYEIAVLFSKLRAISRFEKHNKISVKANNNVYTILRELGFC